MSFFDKSPVLLIFSGTQERSTEGTRELYVGRVGAATKFISPYAGGYRGKKFLRGEAVTLLAERRFTPGLEQYINSNVTI